MNKKIVIANWKMSLNLKEAEKLSLEICRGIKGKPTDQTDIVLCPSAAYLQSVGEIIKDEKSNISLGAQNVFWQEKGPYTGETSALMLRELGVSYVIIGHSERRINLGETDQMINQKLKIVLEKALIPILCLGETKAERENNQTEMVIKKQLALALEKIEIKKEQKMIIAYEPVWAIGSGQTVKAEEAEKIAKLIRNNLKNITNLMVIYGGSVDDLTVQPFIKKSIDGFLVGGASLEADKFLKIIQVINS